MRRFIISAFILVVVLGACAVGGGYFWLHQAYFAAGPSVNETVVEIPKGASVASIAGILQRAGVIRQPRVFRFGHRLFDDARPLRAGEYRFPVGAGAAGAAKVLKQGEPVVYKLTLAEGLTSTEAVDLLRRDPVLTGDIVGVPDEGTLLPETYHFHRGTTRAEMVHRMQNAMDAALSELWPQRQDGLPLASPYEAVILASIVEKETALASERPHVAGVFINRLNVPMRLQSDPTVVYGITNGAGPLGRPLTRRDLDTKTPYNTYQIDRLPPGPIANPGRESLAAVLNPMQTKDLYFVADGTGGHAFAATLDAHNRNVRAWRKLQRAK